MTKYLCNENVIIAFVYLEEFFFLSQLKWDKKRKKDFIDCNKKQHLGSYGQFADIKIEHTSNRRETHFFAGSLHQKDFSLC